MYKCGFERLEFRAYFNDEERLVRIYCGHQVPRRRFMEFTSLVFGTLNNTITQTIEHAIRNSPAGHVVTYGYQYVLGKWIPTPATPRTNRAAYALEHFAIDVIHCRHVLAVVIVEIVQKLPSHPHATSSVVIWWQSNF